MFFSTCSILFSLFVASAGIGIGGPAAKLVRPAAKLVVGPAAKPVVGPGSLNAHARITGHSRLFPANPPSPPHPPGWKTIDYTSDAGFKQLVGFHTAAHSLCAVDYGKRGRELDQCAKDQVEIMKQQAEVAANAAKDREEQKGSEENKEGAASEENKEDAASEENKEDGNAGNEENTGKQRKKTKGRRRRRPPRQKKIQKGW